MTHASTDAAEPPRRANIYGLIACQGDSLTYGSRDPDGMSYPIYLGRLLSRKYGQTWATVNLAVARDGWAEIWRRNYHELLSLPEAREVCLWAGTNDAKQNRSLEQALIACEAVLDQCRAAGRGGREVRGGHRGPALKARPAPADAPAAGS
jgi:hypothetical protein